MRCSTRPHLYLVGLLAATVPACALDEAEVEEDPIDEVGAPGGKADGGRLTDCAEEAILEFLVRAPGAPELELAGLHRRAAINLMHHRNGPDGIGGTIDDNRLDTIAEIDAVPYVGVRAFEQLVKATAIRCEPVRMVGTCKIFGTSENPTEVAAELMVRVNSDPPAGRATGTAFIESPWDLPAELWRAWCNIARSSPTLDAACPIGPFELPTHQLGFGRDGYTELFDESYAFQYTLRLGAETRVSGWRRQNRCTFHAGKGE